MKNCFYSFYLEEIYSIFGENNTYIYIFEKLKENKKMFLQDLLSFMEVKDVKLAKVKVFNKGYGKTQAKLAIHLNKAFKSKHHPKGVIPIVRIKKVGHLSPRLLLQNRLTQKIFRKKLRMPASLASQIKSLLIAMVMQY